MVGSGAVATSPRRPSRTLPGPRLLALVVLVVALVAATVAKLDPFSSPAAEGPPTATVEPLRVEVVELVPRRLAQRLATTGTIRANERIEVTSQIAGRVERILFREGEAVAAGELLVEIDDAELAADRDRVVHQLELSRLREARQRELRELGVTSQQEYDFAASELSVLRAELALVEAQLEKTRIRAPFAGRVGLRRASLGAYLSPGATITTLQQLDPVKVDFTVPERYAGRVGPGDPVTFRVEGAERPFEGEVVALEPSVDPETRSLVVRALSANPRGELVPGSFADVELDIGEVSDALVVPAIAIIPELGGRKVFVVEEGEARPRSVATGIRTEDEVEITEGLLPGERVIVSAIQRLRAGLPVEVAAARGPAADVPGDAPDDAPPDVAADLGAGTAAP